MKIKHTGTEKGHVSYIRKILQEVRTMLILELRGKGSNSSITLLILKMQLKLFLERLSRHTKTKIKIV